MNGTECKEQNMQESVKSYQQNTKLKVLVVDDDLRVRETLTKMLSRLGYECKTASNGIEALNMLQEEQFPLVISDIRMPGMNGIELIRKIKEHHADTDIISITGYSKDNTFTDVIKAGASDFVLKPFSNDEVEAKIARIVQERELQSKIVNSRNKHVAILDGIRDGIYIVDHDFKILSANKALAESVDLPVTYIIGRYCYELLYGQDAPCTGDNHSCPVQKCFSTGLPHTAIREHLQGTGTVYSEVTATPMIKEGEIAKAIVVKRDISELKQSERKREAIKDHLDNIIESSLDCILVSDSKGYLSRVNKSFLEMIDCKKEEVIGKHVTEFIPIDEGIYESTTGETVQIDKEFITASYTMIARLVEEGKISQWESCFMRKDKKVIPVESNQAYIYNEKGDITGSVGIVRDITERKKTENEIKIRVEELSVLNDIGREVGSSLELDVSLRNVLRKILVGTILGLDCGAILLLNKEGDKLLLKASTGLKSAELGEGKEISLEADAAGNAAWSKEPVVLENIEKYDMPTAKILKKEGVKSFASIPIISKGKIHGTINVGSHVQHHFSSNEINTLSLIANQIGLAVDNAKLYDESKCALNKLKKTQSYLLQSEKMASVGQLAAGVAHEINNPTGFVHSNLGSLNKYINKVLELLKRYEEGFSVLKKNGSEEVTSFHTEMEELKKKLKMDFIMKDFQKVITDSLEGTGRIKKIVADLKNFSRVDQEEMKPANINEGIESTVNVVWNELKYKCTVEKNYGDVPQIYCNLGQLNQVFANLLINAAHAIETKGVITISTRYLNGQSADNNGGRGHVEVRISDTGSGIPEDKLNRIFEPFFTTKDVGKGTGLGLSIAYDIIQKHQGEITVQRMVGNGTTFTIKLPMLEQESKEQSA